MVISKINEYLKRCDLHGAQVNLTFNKKTTFQTPAGGILTIVTRLGILAYFLVIVSNIINRDKTVTISVNGKSPTQDYQYYSVGAQDFDIAFSLQFSDSKPHLEERINYFRYFDIKIQLATQQFLTNSTTGIVTKVVSTEDIPLTNCSTSRFSGLSQEIIDNGINQVGWYCPQNINFTLEGQLQSSNRTRLRLYVNLCQNTTANNNICATSQEISTVANQARMQIATLNTYFNEDEFTKIPVKRSINSEAFPVAIGFLQTFERRMRKKTIITKDSWISDSFDNKQYVYYEDIQGMAKLKSTVNELIIFSYGCDSEEHTITRQVLSLADAAASAGGFAGVILMIARLISSIYARPLFLSSILSKLYRYENSQSNPSEEWETYKKNSKKNKINQIQTIINRRANFRVNAIRECCWLTVCLWNKTNRIRGKGTINNNGLDQIRQQMDIVKILKGIRKIKIFERIFLKDYQRQLLKHSSRTLIDYKKPVRQRTIRNVLDQNIHFKQLVDNSHKVVNKKIFQEIIGYNDEGEQEQMKQFDQSQQLYNNNSKLQVEAKFISATKPSSQYVAIENQQDSLRDMTSPMNLEESLSRTKKKKNQPSKKNT